MRLLRGNLLARVGCCKSNVWPIAKVSARPDEALNERGYSQKAKEDLLI